MSNKWIFSATEIDVFSTCKRKWGHIYVDGIKPTPSSAAEFGSLVHKFLFNALSKENINYNTPEGLVATPGLPFLPLNISKNNLEKQIFFGKDGHIFMGYIDFFEDVGSQTWLIGDHKTCSSFSSALKSDELKTNIQANMYAQWAFIEKEAKKVLLKWVYYRTKSSPKALCIEAELSKEEADDNFHDITKKANHIENILKDKTPSYELEKNESACFKYGKCYFYDKCRSNIKISKNIVNNLNKSFDLYIDCTPTKLQKKYDKVLDLSEVLNPVLQKIKQEKDLSHYRMAGYGQHVGLIANYLSQHLETSGYKENTAILSSIKTPEGCDTLQTLSSAAGQIIRGF